MGGGREEVVLGNPRGRYLAGALAPVKVQGAGLTGAQDRVPVTDEIEDLRLGENAIPPVSVGRDVDGVPEVDDGDISDSGTSEESEDRGPASQLIAPSSMGLRFRVSTEGPALVLIARWGHVRAAPRGGRQRSRAYAVRPHTPPRAPRRPDA